MSVGYVCSSSRSHVSAAIYACWKTYAATVAMDNAIKVRNIEGFPTDYIIEIVFIASSVNFLVKSIQCKLRSLEILVNVGVAIFTAKRRTTPGEHGA